MQQKSVGKSIEEARAFASAVPDPEDDSDDDHEDGDAVDDAVDDAPRRRNGFASHGLEVVDSEALIAALPLHYVDLKKSMYPVTKLCVKWVPQPLVWWSQCPFTHQHPCRFSVGRFTEVSAGRSTESYRRLRGLISGRARCVSKPQRASAQRGVL